MHLPKHLNNTLCSVFCRLSLHPWFK